MSFGIVEVISLLLSLSGFGLTPNPKPPTADQALRYAVPDADVVVHLDVASVVPGNLKALSQLAEQPQIKASPELAKLVRDTVTKLEGPRGFIKAQTGIDVVTDITDTTGFFQLVPQHDPAFVFATHGKFTTQTIDKIAATVGQQAVRVGNASWVKVGNDKAVGLTKDGVLLGGTSQLVQDRIADGWKAPPRGKDVTLGYAAEAIAGKPVFAAVVALSPGARRDVVAQLGGPGLASDLVNRHKMATLALYRDGIGWAWVDTSRAGLDSMVQLTEGTLDLLRAAQVAPRGIAKLVLGALDSYKGRDPRIDQLLGHKAELMKIVDTYIGDGQFKIKLDRDPGALRLSARATGKSLSDVMPVGVVVPLAAIALFGEEPVKPASTIAVPAPPGKPPAPRPLPPPPAKKR